MSDCILFCSCSGRNFLTDEKRHAIAAGLQGIACEILAVPDLCGLTVQNVQVLKDMAGRTGRIAVIACNPRSVKWLFKMAGVSWNDDTMHVINAREADADSVIRQIIPLGFTGEKVYLSQQPGLDGWDPWFPVIDYSRCTNCRQCLSFCLFGVYEADEDDRVVVKNPGSCKTNCPACARICPGAAIIFPKHTEKPIDGSEIGNEAELRDRIKASVNEVLGDDIYAALAERRRKARKLLLKRDPDRAAFERKKFSGQE